MEQHEHYPLSPDRLIEDKMTPKEFCQRAKISESTLKRVKDQLPHRATLSGTRYYLPEDILTYHGINGNSHVH
jgi:hypothetical protein